MNRFRHRITIPPIIPLHIPLQMQRKLSLGIRRAGDARERRLAAAGTELFRQVFGDVEAGVAAENVGFDVLDAREGRGEEVEVDLEDDVLHGEIGGEDCDLEGFGGGWGYSGGTAGVFCLFSFEVGGCDPAVF